MNTDLDALIADTWNAEIEAGADHTAATQRTIRAVQGAWPELSVIEILGHIDRVRRTG